jgi:hypothetical protein
MHRVPGIAAGNAALAIWWFPAISDWAPLAAFVVRRKPAISNRPICPGKVTRRGIPQQGRARSQRDEHAQSVGDADCERDSCIAWNDATAIMLQAVRNPGILLTKYKPHAN